MLRRLSIARCTRHDRNIRSLHDNGIGPELVFSRATFVLMERWHRWTYFEARVMRRWIRQRLQLYGNGGSSRETRTLLKYH